MLWELLVLTGAIMFVSAGVQAAGQAHAGFGGYSAVIAIGLLLAAGYEVAAHKLADAVDRHLKARSELQQKWFLRGCYLSFALFPLAALIVGNSVSSIILRLL